MEAFDDKVVGDLVMAPKCIFNQMRIFFSLFLITFKHFLGLPGEPGLPGLDGLPGKQTNKY
jgi:hypothetical protein